MKENNYYNEINHLAKRLEVNKRTRYLQDNSEALNTYWNIGKLIVEAQGGEARAKYGNGLIKEWSVKLTELYGKGYTITNLKYFRQFYLIFKKGHPVGGQLNWSHIKAILPIKDENKRNYYINLCVKRNLSKRELKKEDKAQVEFYMKLINETMKEDFHNATIGIIVSKRQDDFIVSFVSEKNIIPIVYELITN